MSAREFDDHFDDFLNGDFEDQRVVVMLAQLTALLANRWRDTTAHPEPYEPESFIVGKRKPAVDTSKPATYADLAQFLGGFTNG